MKNSFPSFESIAPIIPRVYIYMYVYVYYYNVRVSKNIG